MKLKELFDQFSAQKILVVGDVMLDAYIYGTATKISPEAPVPIISTERREYRPGGAANVAANLCHLGAQVRLIGIVGRDPAAEILESLLKDQGLRPQFLQSSTWQTIEKLRIVSQNQQLVRLDTGESEGRVAPSGFLSLFLESLSLDRPDLIIFSDYAKGSLSEVELLISHAKQLNIPCLVDPKGSSYKRYRGASLVTPNLAEFELATQCHCDTSEQLEATALELLEACEIEAIVVTQAERGMTLITPQGTLHLPAASQEVFDVTGAGDTVIAVLGLVLAATGCLTQALEIANIAAGKVVQKFGTSSLSAEELWFAVQPDSSEEPRTGWLTEPELHAELIAARKRGETVVMTNGCFDILHAGHVQYLTEAKALGDRLLVCVNSDASITGLKGPNRPIVPLEQRVQLLAALRAVDWILTFDEPTPLRLIRAVRPDYLVKGGDYRAANIIGAQEVVEYGGKVCILDLLPNLSTSSLIQRIKEGHG